MYTGETDDQVFSPKSKSFEVLPHNLDSAQRACVERLFASLEVILLAEQQMVPEADIVTATQEWFRPVQEAVPTEAHSSPAVAFNPAHTMSHEGIDHNISNIERQFDGAATDIANHGGLDSALTVAQLTELMERQQS